MVILLQTIGEIHLVLKFWVRQSWQKPFNFYDVYDYVKMQCVKWISCVVNALYCENYDYLQIH